MSLFEKYFITFYMNCQALTFFVKQAVNRLDTRLHSCYNDTEMRESGRGYGVYGDPQSAKKHWDADQAGTGDCSRTRWGRCSVKGNLNFNCLLMLVPPQVLDSVVVHELCHRLEMNHSEQFYRAVHRVFPQYDQWHSLRLRKNGESLMRRMER